jgi:hypothetical protein
MLTSGGLRGVAPRGRADGADGEQRGGDRGQAPATERVGAPAGERRLEARRGDDRAVEGESSSIQDRGRGAARRKSGAAPRGVAPLGVRWSV